MACGMVASVDAVEEGDQVMIVGRHAEGAHVERTRSTLGHES